MDSFTITVDSYACIGCWECYYLCPNENFSKLNNHLTDLRQDYECLGCLSCIYACPKQCLDLKQIYD